MKISIIVLQSLDGFLAKSHDDDLSWGTREDKEFFAKKTTEIGTMVMGSTTFNAMKGVKGTAFRDRNIFVMTSKPELYTSYTNEFAKKIEFISGTPKDVVKRLESEGIKEAAVIGGGKTIQEFLSSGLVDELFITVAPVLFGQGIPLCDGDIKDLNMKLVNIEKVSENEVLLHYKILK